MSRVGNFSSSGIYKLMGKGRGNWTLENTGQAFETYVKEKKWERKLNRPLSKSVTARPTSWGTLVEEQCFNALDLKYSLVSKDRYKHKTYSDYWTGMPDLITDTIVGDIKCPWTLESFTTLIESMDSVAELKKNHANYYWQLVSNSILCKRNTAVLFVYVPYQKDLDKIRRLSETRIEGLQNQFAFINWANDDELPHLPNDCKVSDIQSIEFEVPQEDKELLTKRVELAIEILNKK
jgi:hypothetical protein